MFPDLLPIEASAGAAPPAPTRGPATLALFSPTGRAERRFWEFFTAHIRNPNTRLAYLRHVFTELPKAQSLAEVEALLPTRLDPAALAQDPLQESFLVARQ